MIRLSREIRFALVSPDELPQNAAGKNSWAAWPITSRIAPQLRLHAIVEGAPDPITGYLCNVTLIDSALRRFVHDSMIPSLARTPLAELPQGETVLRDAFKFLRKEEFENAVLSSISLHLSPYLSFQVEIGAPKMIQLTHQFEFSAAHRLHCESMTAEENLATFGKCNNPAGHGHNYVVEVSVARELAVEENNPQVIEPGKLAEIVNRNVIDVLDHKNLNEDIEHFGKLNPSVENICVTIFGWLSDDIASTGCRLTEVKVFETPKTWASYCG
jgi:6-pyruvoyltetrahydropterin/6-carboxytetrahydropterin synthase